MKNNGCYFKKISPYLILVLCITFLFLGTYLLLLIAKYPV